MKIRLVKNILTNDYESYEVRAKNIKQLKQELSLNDDSIFYYENEVVNDDFYLENKDGILIVKTPPGAISGTMALAIFLGTIAVAAIGIGIAALASSLKQPKLSKIQVSPTLRSSQNQARKGAHIPILLGRYRVYPNHAALPYSTYLNNDQYLTQLFCFGYDDINLDLNTLKIGETPISKYHEVNYDQDYKSLYPTRIIESNIGLRLTYKTTPVEIVRTTSNNTYKIGVCLTAPSGLYSYNKEDKTTTNIGFKIQWRVPSKQWQTAHNINKGFNTLKWREIYIINPSGASDNKYEIRVIRTTKESESSSTIDTIYFEALQCYTQDLNNNREVVKDSDKYSLLSMKIKATDQLNGMVDEINCEATLKALKYKGNGSGKSSWEIGETRNPASAILYLLTSPNINATPLKDSDIIWSEFEEFYTYCETENFTCDNYITGDFTISKLCEFIATSNLASIRKNGDKFGIIIDKEKNSYTQMFTPRNASNMTMTKSFENSIKQVRLKFVDSTVGYEEVVRTVTLEDNEIKYDLKQLNDKSSIEINLFGVTNPEHVAKVGKTKLLEATRRLRKYTWQTDIEGMLCTVGDVVLLSNDLFLYGVGEGRVKDIFKDSNNKIKAIILDTKLDIEHEGNYSVRIRTNNGIFKVQSYFKKGLSNMVKFIESTDIDISYDDLAVVGLDDSETHKVLISKISRDSNNFCKIEAVDYAPEVYTEGLSIPTYDPGISLFPDSSKIGSTMLSPIVKVKEPIIAPYMPGSYLGPLEIVPTEVNANDYFLYTGIGEPNFIQYHYYKYNGSLNQWEETTDMNIVLKGLPDATAIAKASNKVVYAAQIYADLIAAQELIIQGSIHSSKYLRNGEINIMSPQDKGFWIGKNGQIKAEGILINNGYFNGLFDCTSLKAKAGVTNTYTINNISYINNNEIAKAFALKMREQNLMDFPNELNSDKKDHVYDSISFGVEIEGFDSIAALKVIVSSTSYFAPYSGPMDGSPWGSTNSYHYWYKRYSVYLIDNEGEIYGCWHNNMTREYGGLYPPESNSPANIFPFNKVIKGFSGGNELILNVPKSPSQNEIETYEIGRVYINDEGFIKAK